MQRLVALFLIVRFVQPAQAADAPKPVSFTRDVAPILVHNCLGCHNAKKAESGLNLATYALLRKGGKINEDVILEPGDADASILIELVRPDGEPRMPYKLPPLSKQDIATLERWVKEGAKLDGEAKPDTQLASLVDPLRDLPKVALKAPAAEPFSAVRFAPDGKRLAAAQGKSVMLFDAAASKLEATLPELPGPAAALRFTPDGQTLVAACGRPGMFGAVVAWDLTKLGEKDTAKLLKFDLRGHADSILAADLAPDGHTLATASYDRLVKLWDIAKGAEIKTLKEHTDAVFGVAFSPDGKQLATAGADRTVKLWDVASGKRSHSFSDNTAEVYAVAFTADGETVLAGGVDRSIRAWRTKGSEPALVNSVFAHNGAILRLVVSSDGKTLYSSGEDRAIKLWDLPALKPRKALADQPDWALGLALAPDGKRLAIGRYDGSLEIVEPNAEKPAIVLRQAPAAPQEKMKVAAQEPAKKPAGPAKPQLVKEASLNPPSPRGAVRGSKVRMNLSGTGVGRANAVIFDDSVLKATIVPAEKPNENNLAVDLEIGPEARPGVHRFGVQTPLGFAPMQSFDVSSEAEVGETEPNDELGKLKPVKLPATLTGAINKAGDVDLFAFEAKAGQELVFETTAKSLGSGLNATLALLDSTGRVLAEAQDGDEGGQDPLLAFKIPADGTYALRVVDAEFAGSGNHFYRIEAGGRPHVTSVFPLGVQPGQTASVEVEGQNLNQKQLPVAAPASAEPGSQIGVPLEGPNGARPKRGRNLVVAEGAQAIEAEPNDAPAQATKITTPGGASGRIEKEGDLDLYRFEAKKGQRLIVEVWGRRLGSPVDPTLEILDETGKPVPRAVLRPVAETFVAFRDHGSAGRNIRLTQWDDFAIDDIVLMGREVTKLSALPRNPDDDAVFWGTGYDRVASGERLGLFETTPEHHPLGQPIYKVEVHPPGAVFPPGGTPPVTLVYRNDDGGPGYGKDARVTFDPPADGVYYARVDDARGFGGARFGYHLVVRTPRPDFRLALSNDNPNVPAGGSEVVMASITRLDGFDGPVEVKVEGLPPGITATSAVVEPDMFAADLLLMAAPDAPATSPPTWKVTAVGKLEKTKADSSAVTVTHTLDPGGADGGHITVMPQADLKLAAAPAKVKIAPGQRVEMTFKVEREHGFTGRVPIQVRNLPRGVRVLNIGLNGVLVTENQTERTVFLYAEPWVEPTERPFYASARLELLGKAMNGLGAPVIASSRQENSPPIWLVVEPAKSTERAEAAAGANRANGTAAPR